MEQSGAKAYLVNTGWNGSGKRISIKDTRGIIDAILNGDILKAPTKKIHTSTLKYLQSFQVLIPISLILVTLMLTLPNGKQRQKTWHRDSSRTSQNTKETKQEKLWYLLVLSYNSKRQIFTGCGFPHPVFSYHITYAKLNNTVKIQKIDF